MPSLPSTTAAFGLSATEADFKSFLSGLREYIAYMLGATGSPTEAIVGGVPSGTAMLFVQAAAPMGWTRQTTHNDKALRIVSGNTTVSSGGSVPFSTAFARTSTDGSSLSSAQLASHAHAGVGGSTTRVSTAAANYYAGASSSTGSAGSNAAHSHGIDLRVQYVDAIIATKD